jgi:hypothetical protein
MEAAVREDRREEDGEGDGDGEEEESFLRSFPVTPGWYQEEYTNISLWVRRVARIEDPLHLQVADVANDADVLLQLQASGVSVLGNPKVRKTIILEYTNWTPYDDPRTPGGGIPPAVFDVPPQCGACLNCA